MPRSEESELDLLLLDSKAQHYLNVKMAKIPPRIIDKGSLLRQLYTTTPVLIDSVPPDLQLQRLFECYDEIKAHDHTALPLPHQDIQISRMIWYYQMDPAHSFSQSQKFVRYNIIVMALVLTSEYHIDYCDAKSMHFARMFIDAWMASANKHDNFAAQEAFIRLWHSGDLDLIPFGRAQDKVMKKRLAALKHKTLPDLPFELPTLLEHQHRIPLETLKKDGPAIALQFCLLRDSPIPDAVSSSTRRNVDAIWESIANKVSAAEEPPDLYNVNWDSPPLAALLKDPVPVSMTQSVEVQPRKPWLDTKIAIGLICDGLKEGDDLL
ncbi:hypothetical protein NX059_011936 [Plenodomus lindquistii]|nr:hypothetical protein NX059_011936 [Plenodomus lindquistii]